MDWQQSIAQLNLDFAPSDIAWLQDGGSLTKFLKNQVSNQQLSLKLIHQDLRDATSKEATRLGVTQNAPIIERIICMGLLDTQYTPWLYARSLFNEYGIKFFGEKLINLGSNFLGELMTNNYPELFEQRSSFEFAYVLPTDQYYLDLQKYFANLDLGNKLIARRSLFKHNNNILFNLDEIFMPALIDKMLISKS